MTTIGNIGIGLFILIVVWIIAIIIFVVGIKIQSNIAWIALGTATSLTVILLIIPTAKHNIEDTDLIGKDYDIIYKNIVLSLLGISCFAAFCLVFLYHCIAPVHPKPIQSFIDR